VIPCDDGVLFCGGVWGKKIGGSDAQRVLAPVARLLDGSRTMPEIVAATGFTQSAVQQVIRALARQGLLEAVDDEAEGTAAAPLTAYLAKTFNPLDPRATVAATLAGLSAASAAVIAPVALAGRIRADLRSSGIGTVTEGISAASSATAALVHDDDGDQAAQHIRDLLARDVPVLRFRIGMSAIEVGPVFYPGCPPSEQACHECLRRGRREFWKSDDDPVVTDAAACTGVIEAGCALAATEGLAILGDLGDISTFRTLIRVTWPELDTDRYVLLPEPGCPSCGREAAPRSGLPDLYEHEVQLWPSFVRKPESPSVRHKRRLDQLQSMRTQYPSSPRIPLPVSDPALADILQRTAGKRRPGEPADPARWTASGGNLGSVELYVIASTERCGWPAGTVFRYDDEAHELVVTTRERLPRPGGARTADYTIILVSAFGRIGYKYGPFSLRLSLLDAGCALAQLSALAALHGLRLSVASSWDPALAVAIELTEGREIIAAIAELTRDEDCDAAEQ
jgi:bacteriocin biosynthesis cyclodehydratase domain-containing protein